MNELINRMKSDLRVGFGFSKANAEAALSLYQEDKLAEQFKPFFHYLKERNPFRLGVKHIILKAGMQEAMNKLNYRMTIRNGE